MLISYSLRGTWCLWQWVVNVLGAGGLVAGLVAPVTHCQDARTIPYTLSISEPLDC